MPRWERLGYIRAANQEYVEILPYTFPIFNKFLLMCRRTPRESRGPEWAAGKKTPVSYRHALEDEVDAIRALLNGNSGGFYRWNARADTRPKADELAPFEGYQSLLSSVAGMGTGNRTKRVHPWVDYILLEWLDKI